MYSAFASGSARDEQWTWSGYLTFLPYPPRGGAVSNRSHHLLRETSRHHRVSLFAFNRPAKTPEQLAECRREFERFCHRVDIWELPFPWKGARWWTQMAFSPFSHHPLSAMAYTSLKLQRLWREGLDDHPQAVVHVDSGDLGLFVEPALRLPTVLNHHNCESAMALRRASLEPNLCKRLVLRDQARKLARLEGGLAHRVALNLTVSEEDSVLLRAVDPAAQVCVVENGTDTEFFRPQNDLLEEGTIVFAGSLRWYPNQSALRYFDRAIWPILQRRRPGIRFYVAGQKPPEFLVRWATSTPGIVFVPDPEDIRPIIARGAVYVCPIVDGGGSRLKLLDAMAMGKAIVSTGIGAEGLRVAPDEHMLIADSPEEFAAKVVSLLEHPKRRADLGLAARKLAEEHYSWNVIGRQLENAYEIARENFSSARRQWHISTHGPAVFTAPCVHSSFTT